MPAWSRRCCWLPPAAPAQSAPATLETTVVTATRTERAALDVPASVDVIERNEVRDAQWRVNLSESLARVPGVVALNRQNYAQDLQISIRGFGARSTFGVRGVRLYLDGIPASQPDGQGQVSNFPLDAVDRIEVLRGPFSALYGNSSGGVIAMTTRVGPSEPTAEVDAAAGGYGTWRSGLSLAGGSDAASASFDASRFSTEGYREHSQATRDVVNLRAAAQPRSGSFACRSTASTCPTRWTRSGSRARRRKSIRARPRHRRCSSTRASRPGSRSSAANLPAISGTAGARPWWPGLGSREVTQYQAIPVAVQASSSHPGGVIDFDRRFDGVDARVQKFFDRATLTAGVNLERLEEDRRGYENFIGSALGVMGRLRRDERNTVTSSDAYLQLEADVAPRWKLTAGARASRVEFRSDDRYLSNGDDSGSVAMSSVNPVVGVVYRPAPSTSWYASYGRGFETPTLNELAYRPDGSAGLNTSLRPARSDNVEVGLKLLPSASLSATVALFGVRTEDDIVVLANVGRAFLVRQRGSDAALWRGGEHRLATHDEPLAAGGACHHSRDLLGAVRGVPGGAMHPAIGARAGWESAPGRAGWNFIHPRRLPDSRPRLRGGVAGTVAPAGR